MAEVLILGIGNPLRGDDGVGWRAASELASRFEAHHVEVLRCHQLTPELAERVAAAGRVIFIDVVLGSEPGLIDCRTLQAEAASYSALSHHLAPSRLLGYTQNLFGVCPEAVQITVSVQSFDYGERFSPAVKRAFPQLLCTIETIVRSRAPSQPRLSTIQ